MSLQKYPMLIVVHVINVSLKKSKGLEVAYELWSGNTPTYSYLRTFGCKAFDHMPNNIRQKFKYDQYLNQNRNNFTQSLLCVDWSSESQRSRILLMMFTIQGAHCNYGRNVSGVGWIDNNLCKPNSNVVKECCIKV